MMCRTLIAILVPLMCAPAYAVERNSSPQRAVPGAGWASVPIPGSDGKQIFQRYCFECHGEGPDKPGTMALAAKYKGAIPARLDQRTDLTEDFVTTTVRHGISVMPSIRKTEIGDAELKAIAAYLAHGKK
jgi:mono/diheme cytochrome c family protein